MTRIQNLQAQLPEQYDACVITSHDNRCYLTGFSSSNGTLFVTRESAYFLTDSRYTTAAKEAIETAEVIEESNRFEDLAKLLHAQEVTHVAMEATQVTVAQANMYREKLPDVQIAFDETLDHLLLWELRRNKEPGEVQKIKQAQRIAETAFASTLPLIRPGITEKELALELDYAMLRNGADALSFETIVVSGENSAKPHGVPGSRKLRHGDFITMDFGAVSEFYHSDMTRTVALGAPNEEMYAVYSIVLKAQLAAIQAAGPGVRCFEVDKAARNIISDAGYGDYFGHGTGHGVGIEIHEVPNLSPYSDKVLEPGDIVTVEPGIYLPGKFGVRIEDMLCITQDGAENLTNTKKELLIL